MKGRFEAGDVVLFTGAGFSGSATNVSGTPIPSTEQLKRDLWKLVYPDAAFEEETALHDIFELARTRTLGNLRDLLIRSFTVDRHDIPEFYPQIFNLSWHRVYTLNVDDLDEAVSATNPLRRSIASISESDPGASSDGSLEVVHLNGRLVDGPDRLTFSTPQYGARSPGTGPLYSQAAVDILARPMVFIGTQLDEPPIWEHLVLRKTAHGKDLRRRSFLVTPTLGRSRKDFLERELHVEHVPMTVEEFANDVLLPARSGAAIFFERRDQPSLFSMSTGQLPKVSELIAYDDMQSTDREYLLGFSPTWSDIQGGRAAERDFESDLVARIESLLTDPPEGPKPILILTGTAGTGKSTACMRLGLRMTAKGHEVGWIDEDIDVSPADIRTLTSLGEIPPLVILDDADRYGGELPFLATDLTNAVSHPITLLSVRSGRAERLADRLKSLDIKYEEFVIPSLSDNDIDRIIDVLDNFNRLGQMKGKPRVDQRDAFRKAERAARQLLIAMIEVTSGRRFTQKIHEELDQLTGQPQLVYAMVGIASAYRIGLSRDHILLGVGDASNETLQAIEDLSRRMLLVQRPNGQLRVRHRVVGEKLRDRLIEMGALREPLYGLTIAMATQLGPRARRRHPAYRALRFLLNHDWLRQALGFTQALQFLAELEPYLNWHHHYWLQRGSLELEFGNESLAENALNQAAALEPRDPLVQTEIGYLRLMQAGAEPNGVHSRELLDEGRGILHDVITSRNHFDPHQYDIYGRMVLRWIRRGDVSKSEREDALRDAVEMVEAGRRQHSREERLRELFVSLQNARLGIDDEMGAGPMNSEDVRTLA